MDWHLLGLSFAMVFVSELGDKSQLAAIALSGQGRSLRAVFLGTAAALLLASFLGVMLGQGASQLIPTEWAKTIAAFGFAAMAVKLLWFGESQELEVEEELRTECSVGDRS